MSFSSEFEIALTAHWWGYKPEEFEALDGDAKSYRIAVYRAKHQLDAVQAQAQADEMKRKSQSKPGKG